MLRCREEINVESNHITWDFTIVSVYEGKNDKSFDKMRMTPKQQPWEYFVCTFMCRSHTDFLRNRKRNYEHEHCICVWVISFLSSRLLFFVWWVVNVTRGKKLFQFHKSWLDWNCFYVVYLNVRNIQISTYCITKKNPHKINMYNTVTRAHPQKLLNKMCAQNLSHSAEMDKNITINKTTEILIQLFFVHPQKQPNGETKTW